MVHHAKCLICDSGDFVLYARSTDYFLSGEEFVLSKCQHCGFIFTQDQPDEKNAGKYYESEDYVSHSDSATGFSNKLYRFSRSIMLGKKKRIVNKLTDLNTGKLLDIGSGTGHFLSVLKNAGWNVKGIEINDKARDYSISKFGLEVHSPEKINTLEPGSFDCITLWHVLEHFHDPVEYAFSIYRLLKPDGVCIVALPNCSSYDAAHFGSYWAAWDVPRHLWHFTPETFTKFSEKAGFKFSGIHNLPPDVFYISILSEKYKGSKMHFFSGLLKGLWFSFLTLFNKNRSSSLIYILRK